MGSTPRRWFDGPSVHPDGGDDVEHVVRPECGNGNDGNSVLDVHAREADAFPPDQLVGLSKATVDLPAASRENRDGLVLLEEEAPTAGYALEPNRNRACQQGEWTQRPLKGL
jgi:hypothetical protein